MTNKELLISALQELVNEILTAPVEKNGTRWCRISPGAFHRAQNALMVVRKPRSPYQKRDTRYPSVAMTPEPGDGTDERPTKPAGER